jgi:hypothetical protein
VGQRNVVYAVLLTAFNAMLFEWPYMILMIHFQVGMNLGAWFLRDFLFLSQYLLLLVFGVYGVLLVLSERFAFQPTKTQAGVAVATFLTFMFWIYYPFPVQPVQFNGWMSNVLFPQTHYAYVNSTIYVPNDGLHLVNVLAKSLLAVTQLAFVRGLHRRCDQLDEVLLP